MLQKNIYFIRHFYFLLNLIITILVKSIVIVSVSSHVTTAIVTDRLDLWNLAIIDWLIEKYVVVEFRCKDPKNPTKSSGIDYLMLSDQTLFADIFFKSNTQSLFSRWFPHWHVNWLGISSIVTFKQQKNTFTLFINLMIIFNIKDYWRQWTLFCIVNYFVNNLQ